jgi:hypothetical protein
MSVDGLRRQGLLLPVTRSASAASSALSSARSSAGGGESDGTTDESDAADRRIRRGVEVLQVQASSSSFPASSALLLWQRRWHDAWAVARRAGRRPAAAAGQRRAREGRQRAEMEALCKGELRPVLDPEGADPHLAADRASALLPPPSGARRRI